MNPPTSKKKKQKKAKDPPEQKLGDTPVAPWQMPTPEEKQQAKPVRRQNMLRARRVSVIDVHAHCIIPVSEIVKGSPLAAMGGGAGDNLLGPQRLQVMDQQGVDLQACEICQQWP